MKDQTKLLLLTVLAFGLVGGMGTASAGIVYQQSAQYPGRQSPWSSSYNPITSNNITPGSLFQTYDNFSLTQTATITNLSWQGASFNNADLATTGAPVLGFNVSFYANSGGVPGQSLFSETIGFTQQAAGPIDLFGNGETETVYNYSATLLNGFTATAGTTYWLSIQAITNYPAIWMWTSGTGGDGDSYQVVSSQFGGGAFERPGDRAFLLGSAPEPSSLALCGIAAVIGLGVARLHHRRLRARPDAPG